MQSVRTVARNQSNQTRNNANQFDSCISFLLVGIRFDFLRNKWCSCVCVCVCVYYAKCSISKDSFFFFSPICGPHNRVNNL